MLRIGCAEADPSTLPGPCPPLGGVDAGWVLVESPFPEVPLTLYLSIYCGFGRRLVSALATAVAIVLSKIITPSIVSGGTPDVCIDAGLILCPSLTLGVNG